MTASEVHLFIIWERARHAEARILDDVRHRFRILDLVEVTWSSAAFTRNLVRLYGAALPPDSDKERECGTGPFLVAVVEVARPSHRLRRLGRRWVWVTTAMLDARARYRGWTGDGFRVHGSESVEEADRDLVLLFGRRGTDFLSTPGATDTARPFTADVIGTSGWADVDELLLALDVTGGRTTVPAPDGADLGLEVGDLWWADHVVGGRDVGNGIREIVIGGSPLRVALTDARR